MPRATGPVLVLLGAVVAAPVAADAPDASEARARLERLEERIETVRDRLREARRKRDRTNAELARLERRIGTTAGRIDALDTRIGAARERLAELERRRAALERELADHRDTLARQLRAAHRLGRQPALRLLLRQDRPGTLARALGYYGYFNRARLDSIERARELMAQLSGVAAQTRATRARLQQARQALERERAELRRARAERARVLAALKDAIAARGDELERLEASRERLERLLADLESVLGDIPAAPLEAQPFATRRQALQWPARGGLRARFGDRRAGGRMRWHGLVIGAERGAPVEAVYHGRVVFADWLEGFGQLLIIDHLDGYLSLYGYNRQLLRSVGDWVRPGETIARVGTSGGRSDPALYFEIRHDGKPVDPLRWLAQR